ncbi:LysR family transcriptional regulator [Peptoniphilus sp. AGMB00490]|uniref:LysR family transcriptional regulator n=2 Tax=Peptoniphilus TaxID=162289 RepID=A0ACD6AZY4_9FIRM|nr:MULTISPECIES: LysR family transcriptional regulator [Peptoniphilus]NMW85221.1 LysR family transcriptional regulator [Peptoniphilus faecalis]OLR65560.1 LysR family transcriptional regulator [Peptoniphilus porci]
MNFESIYYFTELAKTLNMNETSDKLYISQQTLSNHIKRLEDYYGTKLFFRRPKLMLTPIGEEYLKYAEKLLTSESDMINKIRDMESENMGRLIIGASSPRADIFIPSIIEKFTEEFPQVGLVLHEKQSHELEEMCVENKIDIAISIDENYKNENLKSRLLLDEKLYLCVSDRLLEKYVPNLDSLKEKSFERINLQDFEKVPFLLYTQDNRIRALINKSFKDSGVRPIDYIETAYSRIALSICNKALAAVFISQMNIKRWMSEFDDDINIFPLYSKNKPVTLGIYAIKNKNRYITKYAKRFVELLEEYFDSINSEKLEKIAKK